MRFQQKCADARKQNVETKIEFIAAHMTLIANLPSAGQQLRKKAEK